MKRHPALLPLAAVIIGIVFTDLLLLRSTVGLIVSALFVIAGLIILKHKPSFAAIMFIIALGGFASAHFSFEVIDKGPRHLSRFASPEEHYRIYGFVVGWPDLKTDRTELAISVDSLASEYVFPVDGSLLLKVSDTTTLLQRGDRIEFTGRLYPLLENPKKKGFDYGRYLRLKGYSAIVYLPTLLHVNVDRRSRFSLLSWSDGLRSEILETFNTSLSPRSAALASGFLIGETSNIPPDIYRMFRDSGTLHLLAVSGSNVALVLLFMLVLLRPLLLSPGKRSLMLLGTIIMFVLLSYGEPSVIRAGLMGVLVIISRSLGRKIDLNNMIAIAALIILLASPSQLYDVGFQLSFVTAWGLIFATPRLVRPLARWHGRIWYRWFLFPVIISLIAQIVSAPVIAFYFGRIPLVSILANLIIIPLVSIAVFSIMALLVIYLIWPTLGLLFGAFLNQLLELIIMSLAIFGSEKVPIWNLSSISDGGDAFWLILLVYLFLIFTVSAISQQRFRRYTVILLAVTVLFASAASIVREPETAREVIYLEKIPGGVIAILFRPGTDRADIIIPSLDDKRYPIDERILFGIVDRLGVRRIGSLFLISPDYGAVEDLFRFFVSLEGENLYLPFDLRPVSQDFLVLPENQFLRTRINYFGSVVSSELPQGWLAYGNSVILRLNSVSILFTPQMKNFDILSKNHPGPQIVVFSRFWSPQMREWLDLRKSGVEAIIGPKILPFSEDVELTYPSSVDQIHPDYLIDLEKNGQARISIQSRGKFHIDFP